MTKRETILKTVMLSELTIKQTESHLNYQLSEIDYIFLKTNAKKVLSVIPQHAFNCAFLSAILGAKIYDDSSIPVVVITGHLDFYGQRIFNCNGPIPNKTTNPNGEYWDGHCWIELGGYILDISFFRTIYFGQVPDYLKNKVVFEFGKGKGSLMGTPEQLIKSGFIYTPCHILTQEQITGLIAGAKQKYIRDY